LGGGEEGSCLVDSVVLYGIFLGFSLEFPLAKSIERLDALVPRKIFDPGGI